MFWLWWGRLALCVTLTARLIYWRWSDQETRGAGAGSRVTALLLGCRHYAPTPCLVWEAHRVSPEICLLSCPLALALLTTVLLCVLLGTRIWCLSSWNCSQWWPRKTGMSSFLCISHLESLCCWGKHSSLKDRLHCHAIVDCIKRNNFSFIPTHVVLQPCSCLWCWLVLCISSHAHDHIMRWKSGWHAR